MHTSEIRDLVQDAIHDNDVILEVTYTNYDGDTNTFLISDLEDSSDYGTGYFEAYVVDSYGAPEEGMKRTFKIARIEDLQRA